ncbi:cytochrome P450 307a1-like [Dermatophagoides pteronyssinus]|uniref:cytochrome P450 307a1-like n=1 Tax=Dermatophagoides pteronyssinus TaxID=6956 RepID=UPI003F67A0C8
MLSLIFPIENFTLFLLKLFSILLILSIMILLWIYQYQWLPKLRYALKNTETYVSMKKIFPMIYKSTNEQQQRQQSFGLKISDDIYKLPSVPGPIPIPIIGDIFRMRKYSKNPWAGFDQFRQKHGKICRLQLGKFPTVLISSVDAMREVLITKGEHFADRPHFNRHALYFDMNRQNALALCDWTDVHKQRRSIAHAAVIPRFGTKTFQRLSGCLDLAIEKLLKQIQQQQQQQLPSNNNDKYGMKILQKQSIIQLSCSIFFHFLLDKDMNPYKNNIVEVDEKFIEICEKFDLVFSDINEMYLSDFLPILQYFTSIRRYFKSLYQCSTWIFKQVEQIVMERFEQICLEHKMKKRNNENNSGNETSCSSSSDQNNQQENDQSTSTEINYDESFVDRILLLKQYKSSAKFLDFILEHYLENQRTMTWNEMMYEIGDLVGGNSAVGNLLFRVLGHLAMNPESQQQIYDHVKKFSMEKQSINSNGENGEKLLITLEDQHSLPLVMAAIMETLRLTLSPIVPHLSRLDTSIQGHFVPKGTMILFNIYHLNLSEEFHEKPFKFDLTRFITEDGLLLKPDFFFPFSHGRRSCLGYKMVYSIITTTVANLLLDYKLTSLTSMDNHELTEKMLQPKGSLALPYRPGDCYHIGLIPRN